MAIAARTERAMRRAFGRVASDEVIVLEGAAGAATDLTTRALKRGLNDVAAAAEIVAALATPSSLSTRAAIVLKSALNDHVAAADLVTALGS